jgi:hypothetical protein
LSLPTRMCWLLAAGSVDAHSTMMVKMECDRDDCWFISVAPTERFFFPAWQTSTHQSVIRVRYPNQPYGPSAWPG